MLTAAAACSSSGSSSPPTSTTSSSSSPSSSAAPSQTSITSTGAATAGGSITVLEGKGFAGDWPLGLDPATNTTGSADQDYYNAVLGQLFELGAGGKQVDDLATGFQFSNGNKTITIDLRPGVTFSDGTPLTAQVVAWNWTRDLESSCTCAPEWQIARTNPKVTTSAPAKGVIKVINNETIQVNLLLPDGAFINQMYDTIPNWIISEAAFNKMGEKAFAQMPVGAGPFIMVSDSYSNQIVVKKNPNYWDKPLPYLDGITFKSVSGDEAAYEAMLAGEGQVYIDMSTPALLKSSAQKFNVLNQLGTSPYDLQLNTAVPPFNNPKAREAIYAMTNFAPILDKVFDNAYPVAEGFTGPGGICYEQMVPGYQGYNPTLAKQLVAESGLDKTTIQFGTISSSPVAAETVQALSQEWGAFGVKTSQHVYPLNGLIQAFLANGGKSWQAMIQTAGAYDPSSGVGVGFRFNSMSPFSGVHDTKLDTILNNAVASSNLATRCADYNQAAKYIADNYYGPFYFSFAPANVAVKGVAGPGLTSPLPAVAVAPAVLWEDVYDNSSS
ncbi:MAG TPA: ABC transporter substrate-binding protein [Trebonia sp.]|nr:ABC transporter substrate-binding protein [Trebonia sp.]